MHTSSGKTGVRIALACLVAAVAIFMLHYTGRHRPEQVLIVRRHRALEAELRSQLDAAPDEAARQAIERELARRLVKAYSDLCVACGGPALDLYLSFPVDDALAMEGIMTALGEVAGAVGVLRDIAAKEPEVASWLAEHREAWLAEVDRVVSEGRKESERRTETSYLEKMEEGLESVRAGLQKAVTRLEDLSLPAPSPAEEGAQSPSEMATLLREESATKAELERFRENLADVEERLQLLRERRARHEAETAR